MNMSQDNPKKSKELTERLLKYLPLFLAAIILCTLVFKEQYYLKKVEDLSIFLFERDFISESFKIPGGFLGLAGSFMTQFLHLPWLGALLWVLSLLIAYQLTIRVFRIPGKYSPLALIPVALLIIGNMSLGYGIFIMRGQDHFFAPLLGYIFSLIPVATTRHFSATWSRILFLALWIIFGFPLSGVFAFTGALAAALDILINPDLKRKERITVLLSAITLIIIVPLIIYPAYTSYRLAESWTMGLPSISDDNWTRTMRAPFQLALLCQIALPIASRLISAKPLPDSKSIVVRSSIYIIAVAAVWGFWFKDDNFHTELAMSDAVDRYDWNQAIEVFQKAVRSHAKSDAKAYASRTKKIESARSNDEIADIVDNYSSRFFEPTRTMVLYRDLALLKTNRALDEAFTMKDGSRMQKTRYLIPMAWQSGKQFYLQYGLVNMCYRWCLEDVIEHNWSYSTLKYMTMHSVIMQEPELAYKYINKLRKTLFYRKWALQQNTLRSDQEKMSKTQPYKSILPYMCFENQMSNDMIKTEAYLINHFMDKEPNDATPEYDRAALLIAMRIQDIPRFWERLYYYTLTNQTAKIPRSVQEAAILYSNLEKDEQQIPYDKSVEDSYNAFNRYVQNHSIRSMKESAYPYYMQFGKTFYYYYYFIRNLKTY